MLLNTSFNLFGEPLVVTPRDAMRSYFSSGWTRLSWTGLFCRRLHCPFPRRRCPPIAWGLEHRESMELKIESKHLGDVWVLAPQVFQDDRGFFTEVFRADQFKAMGLPTEFVQDNHSGSVRGVLRGLHFQWEPPMGKLMRVTRGNSLPRGCGYPQRISHARQMVWSGDLGGKPQASLGSGGVRARLLRAQRVR